MRGVLGTCVGQAKLSALVGRQLIRRLSFAFLSVPIASPTSAQLVEEYLIGQNAFAFHGDVSGSIRTFKSDAEAVGVVRNIVESMGLPLRFEVRSGPVPNASAILTKDGKRLIIYNVIFMEEIKKKSGQYWSLISIMAHEVGHHLSFHLSKDIDDHTAELEADYFSGFVLAKLDATLEQALAAMRELGSPLSSKTHPKRDDRLQAIATGWKTGGSKKVPDITAVRTPQVGTQTQVDNPGESASNKLAILLPYWCHEKRTFTRDEHAVCENSVLSDLDNVLRQAYDLALQKASESGRSAIAVEQRTWLSERRACQVDVACLTTTYSSRIRQLRTR